MHVCVCVCVYIYKYLRNNKNKLYFLFKELISLLKTAHYSQKKIKNLKKIETILLILNSQQKYTYNKDKRDMAREEKRFQENKVSCMVCYDCLE